MPSSYLAKARRCVQHTQEIPLDHLSQVTVRKVVIGKTFLGRPPPSEHCTDSTLKDNPSLTVQKGYLAWSFSPREGFLPTHLESKKTHPRNISRETPSLCTSLQLDKLPEKSLYAHLELFRNCWPRGCRSIYLPLVWRPKGIKIVVPQDCI